MFVGPCIVIYFHSKTNQMHNISNLFYFGTTLFMFRTVFPSIIRSSRLYIQHQVYVKQVLWLLASKQNRSQKFHFHSNTNQMHKISNFFYFGTTLFMFQTVFLSIIRSLRMYIQHQVYVKQYLHLVGFAMEVKLLRSVFFHICKILLSQHIKGLK